MFALCSYYVAVVVPFVVCNVFFRFALFCHMTPCRCLTYCRWLSCECALLRDVFALIVQLFYGFPMMFDVDNDDYS